MMTIVLIGLGLALMLTVGYGLTRFSKKKSSKVLRQGDYVMFKARYRQQYPGVPTSHALMIEKIEGAEALVVFMTTKSQILKMMLPLHTLLRAS